MMLNVTMSTSNHKILAFHILSQWTDTFLAWGSDDGDPGHPSDDEYDDHAGDLTLAMLISQRFCKDKKVHVSRLPRFVRELLAGEPKQLGEVSEVMVNSSCWRNSGRNE